MKNYRENVEKQIQKQMEYYFGDKNYPKDSFLQNQAKKHEGFVPLAEVMKFNKMRKLTKSKEQVLRAIKDSKVVEVSEDRAMLRKIIN
mmetsp:Transcript_26972/g.20178  ORF Transcript_26972/g.20178 Transcript_26972/m.20178 type:complete len:88 (-) Transcript_26972:18-281(-)